MNRGFVVLVGVTGPGQRSSSSSRAGRRVRWQPARLVKDEDLAHAMARLLRERSPHVQAQNEEQFRDGPGEPEHQRDHGGLGGGQ